jgi:hypothetical protein
VLRSLYRINDRFGEEKKQQVKSVPHQLTVSIVLLAAALEQKLHNFDSEILH